MVRVGELDDDIGAGGRPGGSRPGRHARLEGLTDDEVVFAGRENDSLLLAS